MEATVALVIAILWYMWASLNPKLDWNHETGARLLWFNNPFNHCQRRSIQLYIDKSKIQK